MNNNTENTDSTTAPTNETPEANAPVGSVAEANGTPKIETLTVSPIATFPRIVDVAERATPVKYGERTETMPISLTETVKIDAYFFQSPKSMKLKKIKVALAGLKKAGVKLEGNKDIDSTWFNDNVRDPFHKVLRFAARHSLEHGKPVSLAFSRRKDKDGQVTVTSKHGFEHVIVPPTPKAIEDKANTEKDNQAPKAPKSKRISPLPNPVMVGPGGPAANMPATAV